MEPAQQLYVLQCGRCKASIETVTKPAPRMNFFLCNSCSLKWKEIQDKMVGHAYEDEMRKAFINFVNTFEYLRNQPLRGL